MNVAERSHIYAIQAGDDGPIKIGVANNPVQRLNDLQTGNHRKLRLIGYSVVRKSWALKWEQQVHERLKKHRLQGEWFECCRIVEKLVEMIAHGEVLQAIDVPLPAFDTRDKVLRKMRQPVRIHAHHEPGGLFEAWELDNPGLRVNHDKRVPLPSWITGTTV
jgi:predicted GIY-YIG superfamily endonuclease